MGDELVGDVVHGDSGRLDDGVRLHVLAEEHPALSVDGSDLHRVRGPSPVVSTSSTTTDSSASRRRAQPEA
ncbi:hypothetical protein [Actinacidiphila glaucinigra]|uniref:hypothetical protein n=1 Tax=Actinacidiphila glaucinigra TaxID=235986 RepID=UPI0035E16723